jgi:predicted nucleotidyltransferase
MPPPPTISPVQALEERLGASWKNISDARELSVQTRSTLKEDLLGVDSEDCSVVVSGSLARDEFTPGSDIDWTLLIDGQADPGVIEILPKIERAARVKHFETPGMGIY